MEHTNANEIKLIPLPKILDDRGNLSFLEKKHIGFDIARTYWIYDVPGGEIRGSHAYKKQEEVIIALSGSFDVVLHDGEREHLFTLNRSYFALYVPNMVWRRLENFSTNAVAMIVSSSAYDETDYIRDFNTFKNLLNEQK